MNTHFAHFDNGKHIGEDSSVHGEGSRVGSVRDDGKDVLQDLYVVSLIERLSGLFVLTDVLQELVQDVQSRVGHVAHRVLEGPDDRVEHQFELFLRQAEEGREAVIVDGLQHQIKVGAVLGKLFKVLVDHVQRALEHRVEDFGHVGRGVTLQFVDYRRHGAEHFGLAGRRHAASLVVEEHGVEQRRDEVVQDHFGVVGSRHPVRDEFQRLFLDQSHAFDQRLLRHVLAAQSDSTGYVLRHDFVHVQHVQVDAAQLRHVRVSQSFARSHVCLSKIKFK